MTTSGGALASTAAASFCGNWAFSTTTYSTWVLLAEPHWLIWSPSALSPCGVKLCQPQIVSLVPLLLLPPAAAVVGWPAAAVVGCAAGWAGCAGAVVGAGAGAAGCEHAATRTMPAPTLRLRRN